MNIISNCGFATNINELVKATDKEEKSLKALIKKGAADAVIHAQEQVVSEMKEKLAEAAAVEEQTKKKFGTIAINFCVVKDETNETTPVGRKIAFVKNNRPIDNSKVNKFVNIIATDKYEKAYPIIVAEAIDLIREGYEVYDLNNKRISEEEAHNYFVILDGQHRSIAYAKLIAIGEDLSIPNVHVRNMKNVGEYLVDINDVGTSWTTKDRLYVAALTSDDATKEVFENIAELMNEGFNPSTSTIIYTRKRLSRSQIQCALRGEAITLPKGAKIDIQRGEKFVTLCKAANMSTQIITKRYLINGFNSYACATSEEQAFKALEALRNLNLTNKDLDDIKGNDDFINLLSKAITTA